MKQYKISFLIPISFTFFLLLDVFILQKMEFQNYFENYGIILTTFSFSKVVAGGLSILTQFLIQKIFSKDDKPEILIKGGKDSIWLELLYYSIVSFLDILNWGYYFYPIFILNKTGNIILEIVPKGIILISSSLFCILLLNYKLYRHHILALVIYILGLVAVFICLTIKMIDMKELSSIFALLVLGCICCLGTSVKEIAEKWLMYFKFKNPFIILIAEGIVGTVVFGLVFILALKEGEEGLYYAFDFETNFGMLIVFFISSLFVNFFNIQMNNKYFPSLRAIADSMYGFQIFLLWKNNENFMYLFSGIIPMFIGSLIYNEIIVIPFCNLEIFTKAAVDERVRLEQLRLNRDSMMDLLPS